MLYFSHSARQKFLGGTVYAGIAYGYNELRPYANFGNTASCIEDLKTQALEFSPVTKFRTQSCVVEHGIHITLIGEAMLFPPRDYHMFVGKIPNCMGETNPKQRQKTT